MAVPLASERRVVTVVFVDLAGSTELAARLDPERFRDVLAAFHGMVTDVITGLGGRAEGFIGDAVLGVFGVPALHDDDALRGIRAALDVLQPGRAARARGSGCRCRSEVRIGVNTGQVAIGTATDRNLVIGAEVNIGARLQQAAAPGRDPRRPHDPSAHRRRPWSTASVRMVPAKGFDGDMEAWPVVRMTGGTARTSIPMVEPPP